MLTLYRNIKERRKALGMTQADLAEKIGYVPSMITKIEQGRVDLTLSKVQAFAEALQTTSRSLMGYDSKESSEPSPSLLFVEKEHGKNTAAALKLFIQLDEIDQVRITERMETLLEDEKYTSKPKDGTSLA